MVQCLASFMEACYIARRNAISSAALHQFQVHVEKFHALRNIFIEMGVRSSISLPRQHALHHYVASIKLFGSPNGLCSSITESKHIKAVKEPWRRSSRYHALSQMLQTLSRMEKMATLRCKLNSHGLLEGSTSSFFARMKTVEVDKTAEPDLGSGDRTDDEKEDELEPVSGTMAGAMSDVKLAVRLGEITACSLPTYD